jgi:hypothetical protein
MGESAADRSFEEVRELLASFEQNWSATMAARNFWLRGSPDDGSGATHQVRASPEGERPDDNAFVPIPTPSAQAIADLSLPLTAVIVAFLLPAAADPDRLDVVRRVLREQFGLLLDHTLGNATAIVRELAVVNDGGEQL